MVVIKHKKLLVSIDFKTVTSSKIHFEGNIDDSKISFTIITEYTLVY